MYSYFAARWSAAFYAIITVMMFVSCFYAVPLHLSNGEMFALMIAYLVGHVAIYHWVDNVCFRMWLRAQEHDTNHQKHLALYNRVRAQIDSLGWAVTLINGCIVAGFICQIATGVGNVVLLTGIVSLVGCGYLANCVVEHKEKWFRQQDQKISMA